MTTATKSKKASRKKYPKVSDEQKLQNAQEKFDKMALRIIEEKHVMFWDAMQDFGMGRHCGRDGNVYKGVRNQAYLAGEACLNDYQSRQWLTYNRISELGGQVRKGEYSSQIFNIYFAPLKCWHKGDCDCNYIVVTVPAGNGSVKRERHLVNPETGQVIKTKRTGALAVFNIDQADWSDAPEGKPIDPTIDLNATVTANELADSIISQYVETTGVKVVEVPLSEAPNWTEHPDQINLPLKAQWTAEGAYYSTIFHEMAHSTSIRDDKRVKRDLRGYYAKGQHVRGAEEMAAEIASAYLRAYTGIESETLTDNSAAYVQSWANVIKADPKVIAEAMDLADRISRYILSCAKECAA